MDTKTSLSNIILVIVLICVHISQHQVSAASEEPEEPNEESDKTSTESSELTTEKEVYFSTQADDDFIPGFCTDWTPGWCRNCSTFGRISQFNCHLQYFPCGPNKEPRRFQECSYLQVYCGESRVIRDFNECLNRLEKIHGRVPFDYTIIVFPIIVVVLVILVILIICTVVAAFKRKEEEPFSLKMPTV